MLLVSIIKIAIGLNADVNLLIAEDSNAPQDIRLCIIKKNEAKEVASRGTVYRNHYKALAYKKLGKNMKPYLIEPAFEEKAVFSHEGEEFMYVLEGTDEFVYEGKKYILNAGDSIYFDSIIPHSGRSVGEKKAKIMAVMFSYKGQ